MNFLKFNFVLGERLMSASSSTAYASQFPMVIESNNAHFPSDCAARSNLTQFLRDELGISEASIELALRHCTHEQGTLPMILWRYGFVSIEQLNQIFDWLAQ